MSIIKICDLICKIGVDNSEKFCIDFNKFVKDELVNDGKISDSVISSMKLICRLGNNEDCEKYVDIIRPDIYDIEKFINEDKLSDVVISFMKLICHLSNNETCEKYVNDIRQDIYDIEKELKEDDLGMALVKTVNILCDFTFDEFRNVCKSKVHKYIDKQNSRWKCDL